MEAVALESKLFHLEVVVRTDRVQVRSLSQLLELLWGLVHIEYFLDTVEMVSDVVLVLKNLQSAMNLVFVHFIK